MAPVLDRTAVKESGQIARDFLKQVGGLPPMMKSVLLFCFLLAVVVIFAMSRNDPRAWTLTYIVSSGMILTFMLFMIMYLIRPPAVDTALERGHKTRSEKILGKGKKS